MHTIPEALAVAEQALQAGDHARAQFVYDQILKALPDEPGALNGLGVLAFRAGRLDEAAELLRRAVAGFAGNPAFYNNLYLVYRQQGRHAEAIACCERALELDGQSPELHNNLGIALKDQGELDRAVACFERALGQRPTYADAHYNLANTLAKLHHVDEAIGAYRRALELAPRDHEALNNLGGLLQLQGRLDEALACYDAALAACGESAEAHRNRALLRLLMGQFAEGWAEYEWRWRMPDVIVPNVALPRWEGEPLAGKTVLLVAEQGLGDTIQFVRYARLVQQAGARVLVECAAELHGLFRHTPGIDQLVAGAAAGEAADYYVPLLSLPLRCGTTLETIPAAIPYVQADRVRAAHWQREFAREAGFKVGISWQGNPNFPGDYYRSIPLSAFAPLAECPGVKLFSLQKGAGREQISAMSAALDVVDLGAALGTFDDTAAAITNLDLVVTSDTAIAHVAGALGVPVWVALQRTANFRWLLSRGDSPWYPTMRLFRQRELRQWSDVFADIAVELGKASSASL